MKFGDFPTRSFPRLREIGELLRGKDPDAVGTFRILNPLRFRNRALNKCHNIEDFRRLAKRRVPIAVFDYVEGGAEDEITVKRNRQVFEQSSFLPHVLLSTNSVSTACRVLDRPIAAPLILGPTGFTRMLHCAGEVAVAQAAADCNLIYTLSTVGTVSPEELHKHAPHGIKWFQLYPTTDKKINSDLICRVKESGFEALVITVDTPIGGRKLRDVRSGFTLPPKVTLRSIAEIARKPAWWLNTISSLPLKLFISDYFIRDGGMASPQLMNLMRNQNLDFKEIESIKAQWNGPFIVKGVLRSDDADVLQQIGVDAIIVSNHGGRQLDQSVSSLEALVRIHCESDITAIIDGGIRNGRDIVTALANGAIAAQIGRPYLYGLMAGGKTGVEKVLNSLTSELERTMTLLGLEDISSITSDCLFNPQTLS